MERVPRLEPVTSSVGSRHSAPELLPPAPTTSTYRSARRVSIHCWFSIRIHLKIIMNPRPDLGKEETMPAIPEKYLDLLQKKAFAQLATLMPDGSPHVAPVWCDYD